MMQSNADCVNSGGQEPFKLQSCCRDMASLLPLIKALKLTVGARTLGKPLAVYEPLEVRDSCQVIQMKVDEDIKCLPSPSTTTFVTIQRR